MTDQAMVLCPRTAEGTTIKSSAGDFIGQVSLNGTILGGTLLVKSEAEWDALKSDESKLKDVLDCIGIASIKADYDGRL
jgi:ATP adenylyltransferase